MSIKLHVYFNNKNNRNNSNTFIIIILRVISNKCNLNENLRIEES